MKKALLVSVFLLLLLAIPVTLFLVKQNQDVRQRAAEPQTELSFSPATVNLNADQTQDLNVMVVTKDNTASVARLNLKFSPDNQTCVKIESIKSGSFFTQTLVEPVYTDTTASITLGSGTTPVQTTTPQPIATVTVRGISAIACNVQLIFDQAIQTDQLPGTFVLSTDKDPATNSNRNTKLVFADQAVISVAGGTAPSPSPTPSPSSSGGPSPTASPALTTTISQPANGATVTTKRPTFSGKSFANGLVILSISTTPVITANITVDTNGNWTYTATQDIPNGSYTITITATQSGGGGTPEVVTSTFTVAAAGGSNPSPSPSSPRPSASSVPVTGSTAPTFFLLGVGLILAIFGSGAIFFR